MPLITASRIHNGHQWLPEGTAVEVADDGVIIALHDGLKDNAIHYEGILAPGLVNAHCHLELSHMQGLIPQHTGLIPFLKNIPLHRNDFTSEQKKEARHAAYHALETNGTVAVGDIANVADTLDIRALDKMHIYTFIEAIGFSEVNAPKMFEWALNTYKAFAHQPQGTKLLRQAIVPHAPYSVSSPLFKLISNHNETALLSIHNQESIAENEYYTNKRGAVRELLHTLGVDDTFFVPSGKTSLQTYMEWLLPHRPLMLVHNTYTTAEDARAIHQYAKDKVYWCLCPNANLYIENALPNVQMLMQENATICIGTDSLASNTGLNIISELYTLKKNFSALHWEQLLIWATYNGACALQMDDIIGSIAPGKYPGIIQITGIHDDAHMPVVKRIV